MLIRKPASEVFAAFADPEITSKFWFSEGSDYLRDGATVTWTWAWYNFSSTVEVTGWELNKRIVVDWYAGPAPLRVEWSFTEKRDGTFVEIATSNFQGADSAAIANKAIETSEGFAFVLAGAKAWLEHGVQLRLVPDRFPSA